LDKGQGIILIEKAKVNILYVDGLIKKQKTFWPFYLLAF